MRTSIVETSIPAALRSVIHPHDVPIFFDNLRCPYDARYLSNCTFNIYSRNDASPSEGVGINCLAQTSESDDGEESGIVSGDWRFRLAKNGRVDVKPLPGNAVYSRYNDSSSTSSTSSSSLSSSPPKWGTICHKGMSRYTPSALCRILGYPQGIGHLTYWYNTTANSGYDISLQNSTPIYLSQVRCPHSMSAGNFSPTYCRYENYNSAERQSAAEAIDGDFLHSYNPESAKFCNHSFDVGLLCNSSMQEEGVYVGQRLFMRIDQETNALQVRKLVGIDENTNSELYSSSKWNSVCRTKSFSMKTAISICRMLGFKKADHFVGISDVDYSSSSTIKTDSRPTIGLRSLTCDDAFTTSTATREGEEKDITDIGHCNYEGVFSFEYCPSGSDLALICDAEAKGVASGDNYWRVLSSSSQNNNNNEMILQARPKPSSLHLQDPSNSSQPLVVNPYPIVEGFGAVESLSSSDQNNNAIIFSQTTANLMCRVLGFPGTANDRYSTTLKIISHPATDYSEFNTGVVPPNQDTNPLIREFMSKNYRSSYWNELKSYDTNEMLDKIVLRNLTCPHHQSSLSNCSMFEWSQNLSTNLTHLIEVLQNGNRTNSSSSSSSSFFKSGGQYSIITLNCDATFVNDSRDIGALVGFVVGGVGAFLVALLIVCLLIKFGILSGYDDEEEEEKEQEKNDNSNDEEEEIHYNEEQVEKYHSIQNNRTKRPLPPPPPSDSGEDDEIMFSNNNDTTATTHHRGAVGGGMLAPPVDDDDDDQEPEELIVTDNTYQYEGGVLGTRNRYLAGYDDPESTNNSLSPPRQQSLSQSSVSSPPVVVSAVVSQNRYGYNNNNRGQQQQQQRLPEIPNDGFGTGNNTDDNDSIQRQRTPPEAQQYVPLYPRFSELPSLERKRQQQQLQQQQQPMSNRTLPPPPMSPAALGGPPQQDHQRQQQPVNRRVLSPFMPGNI